jgi:hypothetical protein
MYVLTFVNKRLTLMKLINHELENCGMLDYFLTNGANRFKMKYRWQSNQYYKWGKRTADTVLTPICLLNTDLHCQLLPAHGAVCVC